MIRADFLGPRSYDYALVDQLLTHADVEIFIDLAVVDEPQIAVISQKARPDAVDRVDGAPLELIEVAGDDFGAGLDIGDQDRNLVLIAELAKRLPGTMAHLKVPIRHILRAQLTDDPIEVEDEQVLVLQSLSSLEKDALGDEGHFRCVGCHMLLR